MTRNNQAQEDGVSLQGLVARYECMDCGQVGPHPELLPHAKLAGCRNFRTTTSRWSPQGRLLDERVEVRQLTG